MNLWKQPTWNRHFFIIQKKNCRWYFTSFVTKPSLSLSMVLKILSMWFSSPRNSSNDNFPSRFLSRILKNPSTSLLKYIIQYNYFFCRFSSLIKFSNKSRENYSCGHQGKTSTDRTEAPDGDNLFDNVRIQSV